MDVFLDALDDPELAFQVHTQRARDLVSAVQTARYLEAVMHSFPSRSSKPVRAVVQAGDGGKIEAELRDIRAGKGTCWMSWSSSVGGWGIRIWVRTLSRR